MGETKDVGVFYCMLTGSAPNGRLAQALECHEQYKEKEMRWRERIGIRPVIWRRMARLTNSVPTVESCIMQSAPVNCGTTQPIGFGNQSNGAIDVRVAQEMRQKWPLRMTSTRNCSIQKNRPPQDRVLEVL